MTVTDHPYAQAPTTRSGSILDALTGKSAIRRWLFGEQKLATPTFGEPALALLVLLWTGVAFLPAVSFPTLTATGPLSAAVSNDAMLWAMGLWGVAAGIVQLAGFSLAWFGRVYPLRRVRIAFAFNAAMYHVAILWIFTEGGASFPIGPYLALFGLSLLTLAQVIRNGQRLEELLRSTDRDE